MDPFGKLCGPTDEVIRSTFMALQAKEHSPFVLCDKDLDIKRIGELTGFTKGTVLGPGQFSSDLVVRQ